MSATLQREYWIDQNPLAVHVSNQQPTELAVIAGEHYDCKITPEAMRLRTQRDRARAKRSKTMTTTAKPRRHRATRIRILHEPSTGQPEEHISRTHCLGSRDGRARLFDRATARADAHEIKDALLGDPITWACKLLKPKAEREHPDADLDQNLRTRGLLELEARTRARVTSLIDALEVSGIAPIPDGLPPLTHAELVLQ